jgi:hypothetical protein
VAAWNTSNSSSATTPDNNSREIDGDAGPCTTTP